jgi:hypothetical protein
MELVARRPFLELLQATLSGVQEGDGDCVFVIREAGVEGVVNKMPVEKGYKGKLIPAAKLYRKGFAWKL